jgi:hypothetical protein
LSKLVQLAAAAKTLALKAGTFNRPAHQPCQPTCQTQPACLICAYLFGLSDLSANYLALMNLLLLDIYELALQHKQT